MCHFTDICKKTPHFTQDVTYVLAFTCLYTACPLYPKKWVTFKKAPQKIGKNAYINKQRLRNTDPFSI